MSFFLFVVFSDLLDFGGKGQQYYGLFFFLFLLTSFITKF